MPQIAIRRQFLVFRRRPALDELQPRVIDKRLEITVGGDGDVMPALLEAQANADERMHVAMRPQREEQDIHKSQVIAARARLVQANAPRRTAR